MWRSLQHLIILILLLCCVLCCCVLASKESTTNSTDEFETTTEASSFEGSVNESDLNIVTNESMSNENFTTITNESLIEFMNKNNISVEQLQLEFQKYMNKLKLEVPASELPLTESPPTESSLPELTATIAFWPWQVLLIVVYSGTALLSLTLNIISILVMIRKDRSISTELWKFLVNLSVADIGMAIFCIPFTYTEVMLEQWIFSHWFCPLLRFAQTCFVFVSVWTLTIIGIDRYFAIVHPLYLFHWIRSHKNCIIYCIWAAGAILAGTEASFSRAQELGNNGTQLYKCEPTLNTFESNVYTIVVFVLMFACPIVILVFVYTSISLRILEQVTPGNPDSFRDRQQLNRKIKVLKMLATIVGLFALCWLPMHLMLLLVEFMPGILHVDDSFHKAVFYVAFFTAHFLSMAHSFVNPIVYCFMSDNFRLNLHNMVVRYLNWMKRCDSTSSTTFVCPTTSGGYCAGCMACARCGENIELGRLSGHSSNGECSGGRTYTTFNSRTNRTFTKVAFSEQAQPTQQMPIATLTYSTDLYSKSAPNERNHCTNRHCRAHRRHLLNTLHDKRARFNFRHPTPCQQLGVHQQQQQKQFQH